LSPLRQLFWLVLPLLACAQPFAGFAAANVGEAPDLRSLAVYGGLAAAAVAAFYLVTCALMRPQTPTFSVCLAGFLFVLFRYGASTSWVAGQGGGPVLQNLAWLALLFASLGALCWLGRRSAIQYFLLLFAAANLSLALFAIASFSPAERGPGLPLEQAYPLADNDIWSGQAIRRPNIYLIVADSYPSQDQLRSFYHFDNSAFRDWLEARGFAVFQDSYSNYNYTRFSMSSLLDMEYVFDENDVYSIPGAGGPLPLPGSTNRGTLESVAGDNRSVAFLKQLGYRQVRFDPGTWNMLRCHGFEDRCLRPAPPGPGELESGLLGLVPYDPVEPLIRLVAPSLYASGDAASGTGIPELAVEIAALDPATPIFLYAHLASPHAPFLNDQECRRIRNRLPIKAGFVRQLKCVNRELRKLLDQLLGDDPDAIIVLTSDHGPRFSVGDLSIYGFNELQIRESLGIMNAFHLPASCRADLPPRPTPVDTMRLVFACLGGHEPKLLEARHYVVRPKPLDQGKIRRVDPY
jgi:hypothetical protein